MPDFETIDREGRPLRLAEYRGKLVLVDFWLKDWVAWKRDLPQLVQLHQRYQPRGFEIIGVSMGAAPGDLDAFLAQNGMTWRQVEGDRTLARNFGVVGEAANFLVDPNGTIVGRDLHGGELAAAIRFSLEGR
jgi:peroxiredoxin